MKKETIIWQIIIIALGSFLIFTIKIYLGNRIIVEAMKIQAETMANRANCYLLAEEKNLNNGDCGSIDTTAYRLFKKYELINP